MVSEFTLAAVGLLVAFGGLEVAKTVRNRALGRDGPDEAGTLESDLTKWVVALALVGYVLVVEGRSLASIGVEAMAPLPFLGWVVGGTVLTMALGMAAYTAFEYLDIEGPEAFVAEQSARSVPARLFTALSAGVTESILFQGYPIERLASLTGSIVLAGAVSFLVFTAVHYVGDTYDLTDILLVSVPALSVTVLYVLSGNLLVVVTVHTLVDAISLLSVDPSAGGDDAAAA